MTQYKAWCPDYADEDDARTIEAWAPDDAAEMLAEHYHNEEAFDHPIEIHVKTMAGELSKWTVHPEPYVSFSAYEFRP